jgi:hypothetical protein
MTTSTAKKTLKPAPLLLHRHVKNAVLDQKHSKTTFSTQTLLHPYPVHYNALCYKADESADESKNYNGLCYKADESADESKK